MFGCVVLLTWMWVTPSRILGSSPEKQKRSFKNHSKAAVRQQGAVLLAPESARRMRCVRSWAIEEGWFSLEVAGLNPVQAGSDGKLQTSSGCSVTGVKQAGGLLPVPGGQVCASPKPPLRLARPLKAWADRPAIESTEKGTEWPYNFRIKPSRLLLRRAGKAAGGSLLCPVRGCCSYECKPSAKPCVFIQLVLDWLCVFMSTAFNVLKINSEGWVTLQRHAW